MIFLYTLTINCVTIRTRNIYFVLFVANKFKKNVSSRKNYDLFSSVLKNIILNSATPSFQAVSGVTQSRIFCRRHESFALSYTNLIDYYSQGILTLLFITFSN